MILGWNKDFEKKTRFSLESVHPTPSYQLHVDPISDKLEDNVGK